MKKTSRISISLWMTIILSFSLTYSTSPLANTMDGTDFIQKKLSMIINNDPTLKGAIAGVSIRSATTGKILFEHLGDNRLIPASNLKLFTAAAALSVLGENYSFSTELLADGPIVGNILFGNLFLKGKGDPTLLKSDIDYLANQLLQKGVTEVHGNLIGDDKWYDNVRYSQDLPWSDEQTYYGAQVSALTASPNKDFDAGTVILKILPSQKVGDRAIINFSPDNNYVSIVNKTKTVQTNEKKDIDIIREHGTNRIIIKGTIPVKSGKITEWISVWNPSGFALNLFQQSLRERGIVLIGEVKEGVTSKKAILLAANRSMPLGELLVPFMKLSNNVHAETLIKEMGKVRKGEGSWEKGLEVFEEELKNLGVNTETMVLRDGSGISHLNLVPTNEISKLLFTVQKADWFPTFQRSLPIGGEKEKMVGGTLRRRTNLTSIKGKIKAKTGTLTSVSSLSGYVQAKNGETFIFSVILNNLLDEKQGKNVEDRIVSILANE